jgi:hypothetical protein
MNISVTTKGLSANESGDFQLVCRLCEMHWSDFEVRIEHDEQAAHFGRQGRKLIHVLHRISGRRRTYRAGMGNDWVSAFEEDVRAYCFTSLFKKPDPNSRRNSRPHASSL